MRIRFTIRQLLFGVTACCAGAALLALALHGTHAVAIIESRGGFCDVRHPDWWYPAGLWPNDAVQADLTALDITDYSFLARLPHLEMLYVEDCQSFSDDDVEFLAGMPSLRELDLQGTGVTSRGIDALRGNQLTSLSLRGARIDDECLLRLLRLPSLRGIDCRDTDVTRAGAERFVAAREGAEVVVSDDDDIVW
ncbi:MAG: hypothetical protein U0836_01415 [Pirellulales bacterium]